MAINVTRRGAKRPSKEGPFTYLGDRKVVDKQGKISSDLTGSESGTKSTGNFPGLASSPRKKILYVAPQPFFEVRGTPIATRDMLGILSRHYDIDFISYPLGQDIALENVTQYRSFSFGFDKVKIGFSLRKLILDFALMLKTYAMARREHYDVIHATEEAAYWCSKIASRQGIPFVYDMDSIMSEQLRESGWRALSSMMRRIEVGIVNRSDLILGISDDFEPYCRSHARQCNYMTIWDVPQVVKKEPLADIYENILEPGKKKVLYIGNGEYYQGVELIERVAPRVPDLQFIIAGAGPDGRKGNINYINRVPMEMVADLMSRCDVLAAPRRAGTNTPMKLYTYMSAGKPIVATRIKAHNVLEGCGILVDKNVADFQRGVMLALGEQGQRHAVAAKEKVESQYSFEKLEQTVLRAYGALS